MELKELLEKKQYQLYALQYCKEIFENENDSNKNAIDFLEYKIQAYIANTPSEEKQLRIDNFKKEYPTFEKWFNELPKLIDIYNKNKEIDKQLFVLNNGFLELKDAYSQYTIPSEIKGFLKIYLPF